MGQLARNVTLAKDYSLPSLIVSVLDALRGTTSIKFAYLVQSNAKNAFCRVCRSYALNATPLLHFLLVKMFPLRSVRLTIPSLVTQKSKISRTLIGSQLKAQAIS